MDPCLFQSISSTFQNAELATSPLEINQKCEELIQIIKESAFSLFHASYFSRAHTRDSLASLRTYIGSKQMSEAISTQFTLILSALAAIDNRRHLDSAFDAFPDKIHQCIAHRFPTISNNETDTRGTISKFESIYGHRKTFLYEKILPTWIASQNIRIEHLPFDLFNEWFFMFQYLTKINYTNKRSTFIIGLDETITTLKELTVNNELLCGTNFDISRTPKLQVLKYARAELTNGFSEQLRSLKNLTKLSLTDAALTESFINKFSAITQLKRLHIATENRIDYAFLLNMPHLITFKCQQLFSDTDTTFISALTNLESLKVHRNALSDQGIKTLCEMTKLEEIKLWNSSRITNAGMKNLNRLTALTQLNTNNCPGIDNEVLEHLSTLTNLQSLALNFCNNKQFELQPADIFKN